ncbi:MAG: hypothetical protein JWP82_1062 [Humibacillus sp.]|nr:hypothetical protein [Humibacillus sp.]
MTSTPDRQMLAARNNALWCDVVARSHGVTGVLDELGWTSPTRTPPYYPDAVTLSPDAEEYDLLARVDDSDGCSVKDSWGRLDLSLEDFARIVVGEWVWLDPQTPLADAIGSADSADSAATRRWSRVTSAEGMSAWVAAWSTDPEAAGILRASLLDEPGVHVLAASSPDDADDAGDAAVVAGAILHVTGEVAGLGNLFARDGDSNRVWREAAATARDIAPGLPLVGWEAGVGLEAALAAGCEAVGALTVWLK